MTLKPFTPGHLVATRRVSGYDLSPDGRWAVLAVDELAEDGKSYVTNFLRLDLASGGAQRWLTRDERKKGSPKFVDAGTVAYLSQPDPAARRPGHLPEPAPGAKPEDPEKAPRQLFRIAVDGGSPEQLTDLPCGVDAFACAPGAAGGFALLAGSHPQAKSVEENRELEKAWKERKATGLVYDTLPIRFWDHWLGPKFPHLIATDASGQAARDLTPGLGFGFFEATLDVSPDGARACADLSTIDEEKRTWPQLEVFDLATGARRALTKGPREHSAPRWNPSGTHVATLTSLPQPRVTAKQELAVVDAATGETRIVSSHLDLWPARPIWLDDERLAFSHDWRGHSVLRVLHWRTGESRLVTERGNCTDPKLSADGRHLYFVHDRVDDAPDLWRVPVEGGAPERVGNVNAGVLDGVALSPATSHVVTGAEGAPVQLFEVRPPDFDATRKYPLLLWIHGGPVHSYLDQFHFRWNAQIYASLGYVVIQVNPRGSTGFGQEFIQGNNGNWGDLCFRDLMAVTDEWVRKPYVDADRVAAMGASFGGYMVNWIAGHETRFRCLVSHAGLFHLPAFQGTTDAGPWWELEFGGKPWENPELYELWSPHRHAGKFKTPTLVIHGDLDYRVPIGDGLQMFLALQREKVPSKFLFFPDENHWILKPANMLLWNETVIAWLKEWMG